MSESSSGVCMNVPMHVVPPEMTMRRHGDAVAPGVGNGVGESVGGAGEGDSEGAGVGDVVSLHAMRRESSKPTGHFMQLLCPTLACI